MKSKNKKRNRKNPPTADDGNSNCKNNEGSGNNLKLVRETKTQEAEEGTKQNVALTKRMDENQTKNGGGDNGAGEAMMAIELDENNTKLEEYKQQLAQRDTFIQELSQRIHQLQLKNKELRDELNEILADENKMKGNSNGKQTKIELPLETWVDMFEFVPRRQLVKLLPRVKDRQFAQAIQYILLKVGQFTLGQLRIIAPREDDMDGCPMVKVHKRVDGDWRKITANLANSPMPENVKNFTQLIFSYIDISVINFLRHFQQKSLLENVHLKLTKAEKEKQLPFLTQLLPVIDSIDSIQMDKLLLTYVNDSCSHTQMLRTVMTRTRILQIGNTDVLPVIRNNVLNWLRTVVTNELDWICHRWLYIRRDDGKPRVLIITFPKHMYGDYCVFPYISERIKKAFLKAKHPVQFFISIVVSSAFQWPEDILLKNSRTNERFAIKRVNDNYDKMLISRYPSWEKLWIKESESEVLGWNSDYVYRHITLRI